MDSEPPLYCFEVAYYRSILRLSYESGRRYLKLGVIEPAGQMSDGRPIFRIDSESVRLDREKIHAYRRRISRVRHNLPTLTYA